MDLQEKEISLSEIREINDLIKGVYNFDFSDYAMSSYKRRVLRFMSLEKLNSTEELLLKIENNKVFFNRFLQEITVNTTEMFRSPQMWKKLRTEVLPKLKFKPIIRVWHAGCSSGEEVFSLAILFRELGMSHQVNIMATDINDSVIDRAREGIYSTRSLELNKANYHESGGELPFSNYYTVLDGDLKYQVDPTLLEKVKFYKHDLVKEESFGKFDIILCRNVLIYFNKALQENVYKLFLDSLNEGGYLAIGSKESMVWSSNSDKYNVVSDKEKIYQLKIS